MGWKRPLEIILVQLLHTFPTVGCTGKHLDRFWIFPGNDTPWSLGNFLQCSTTLKVEEFLPHDHMEYSVFQFLLIALVLPFLINEKSWDIPSLYPPLSYLQVSLRSSFSLLLLRLNSLRSLILSQKGGFWPSH